MEGKKQSLAVERPGAAGEEDVVRDVEGDRSAGDQVADDGLQLTNDPIDVLGLAHVAVAPRLGQWVRWTRDDQRYGTVDPGEDGLAGTQDGDAQVGRETDHRNAWLNFV